MDIKIAAASIISSLGPCMGIRVIIVCMCRMDVFDKGREMGEAEYYLVPLSICSFVNQVVLGNRTPILFNFLQYCLNFHIFFQFPNFL